MIFYFHYAQDKSSFIITICIQFIFNILKSIHYPILKFNYERPKTIVIQHKITRGNFLFFRFFFFLLHCTGTLDLSGSTPHRDR